MAEVDIKGEIDKLNEELRLLASKLAELVQQGQTVGKDIIKAQGALEALERLDTSKGK